MISAWKSLETLAQRGNREARRGEEVKEQEEDGGSSAWQSASLALKRGAAAVGRQIDRPMTLVQRCLIRSLTNNTRYNKDRNDFKLF